MNQESWKKIKEIFQEGDGLPVEERIAYTEQACHGNQEMLSVLRMMLGADEDAMNFLDEGVIEDSYPLQDHRGEWSREIQKNSVIGSYRIERKLGSGGMGTVYLAHRGDETYQRKAAIKILSDSSQPTLRRFQDERQILANLDHPNIARLYDGGALENGQPYLIMEYVDGLPIHHFCENQKLTIDARLTLFRKVCSAVDFAHRNLIVHRDIKPGNILVTQEGEPKLLDFGIAKILDANTEKTMTGLQIMTPRYASPEQIVGGPITTATDTYALGLLLYELLTCQRPFDFEGKSVEAVCHIIMNTMPPAPSLSLNDPNQSGDGKDKSSGVSLVEDLSSLRRHLSGDLDIIVMKALRKEPDQRYVSSLSFSDDIGRYMDGFPIQAKKATWWEGILKFVTRRPLPVTAVCLLTLLISGLCISLFFQQKQTALERDRVEAALVQARLEKERAESVGQMMLDLFQSADPDSPRAGNISARELLDNASLQISKNLKADPELRARFMKTLGSAYLHLGFRAQADPLLDQALLLGIEMDPDSPSLVDTQLLRVKSSMNAGDYKEAGERLQMAHDIVQTHFGPDHWEMAAIYYMKASLQTGWTRYHEAVELLEKCVAIMERDPMREPYRLSTVYIDLGSNYFGVDQSEKSLPLFEKALALQKKAFGVRHHSLSRTLRKIAFMTNKNGEPEKAEAYYRHALAIMEETFGEKHLYVTPPLFDLGYHLGSMGRIDEGYQYLQRNFEVVEDVQGAQSEPAAFSYFTRARYLRLYKRFEEAEALYLEGLAIYDTLPVSTGQLFVINSITGLYKEIGDDVKFEAWCKKGLELGTRHFGADHPRVAMLAESYAAWLEKMDKRDDDGSISLSLQKLDKDIKK